MDLLPATSHYADCGVQAGEDCDCGIEPDRQVTPAAV